MVSAARPCVPSTSVVGARCDRLPTVNARSAQELLAPLATQQTDLGGGRRLIETYTMEGLLGLLWHGPLDAEDVVLCAAGGTQHHVLGVERSVPEQPEQPLHGVGLDEAAAAAEVGLLGGEGGE